MWACVFFTQLLRLVEQVIMLDGQLVFVNGTRRICGKKCDSTWADQLINVIHYVGDIVVEFFGKSLKLLRQICGQNQRRFVEKDVEVLLGYFLILSDASNNSLLIGTFVIFSLH